MIATRYAAAGLAVVLAGCLPASPERAYHATLREELEGTRGSLAALREGLSEPQLEVERVLTDDASSVASVRVRGLHTGPLFGFPPTGRRVAFRVTLWRQANAAWIVPDLPELRASLDQAAIPAEMVRDDPGHRVPLDEAHSANPGRFDAAVAFSPNGRELAFGGGQRIWLMELASGALRSFEGPAVSVVFSPDGKMLAAAGLAISLLELSTGREVARFAPREWPRAGLRFSPDGRLVASDGGIWDAATHEQVLKIRPIGPLVFSPDGNELAIGTSGRVRRFSTATGEELPSIRLSDGPVQSVVYSGSGELLAMSQFRGATVLWDRKAHRVRRILQHESDATALAFSPASDRVACGHRDGTVTVHDVAGLTPAVLLESPRGRFPNPHWDLVRSVAISRDGSLLASLSDKNSSHPRSLLLELWDLRSRRVVRSIYPSEATPSVPR